MKNLAVSIILAILLLASPALADPSTGPWLDAGGTERAQVKAGATISYSFTTAVDSKVVKVLSPKGDFCFDPDSSGASGVARIVIRRSIINATTNNSIQLPAIPFDGTNCVEAVLGSYWVEVTTPATGGETPVVSLTGRN